MLDCDGSNSSTTSVFPNATFCDLSRPQGVGPLLTAVEDIATGVTDMAVVDCGARDEGKVHKLLPVLTAAAARRRVKIVFVRPVTTSHFVQANVADFIPIAQKFAIALVLAEVEAMGRDAADFAEWRATKTRARAVEYGAAFVLPDFGALLADNASSFSLSLSAVARGDFSAVGPDYDEPAKRIFNRDTRAFVAGALAIACEDARKAISEAMAKV